ncbi:MAG: hypothetical protein GW913_09530, partial [Myxococcales bacterium]|nr:hypothetical protein [Myxococcales bacterium]
TPVSCDDSDACTADSCNPATGCTTTPMVCPGVTTCAAGVCV